MWIVRGIKLMCLIVGVAIVDVIVLSPGLLHVELGSSNKLESAVGVTILIMSMLALGYGTYRLMFAPVSELTPSAVKSHDDYIEALRSYRNVKGLKKDVSHAMDQLNRLQQKKGTILEVLDQRFERSELSFRKFLAVILEVEKLFYSHINGVLHKVHVCQASSLTNVVNEHKLDLFSERLQAEKKQLYNQYLTSVKAYLSANEEILLKLDQLLLEIARLGYTDFGKLEELPCMQEIDTLIKQTSYYQS